jgi:ArsR family metal-binding transcriptional regulator
MENYDASSAGPAQALICDYELELCSPPCKPGADTWSARAVLLTDIGELLPYLNAQLDRAEYDHDAQTLIWKGEGHSFAFRRREIKAAPARDREEARSLIERAVALANETWRQRESIEPRYQKRANANLMQIYRLLPRTNCGRCGCATCMAFAARLREGDAEIASCPDLDQPRHTGNRKSLLEALAP